MEHAVRLSHSLLAVETEHHIHVLLELTAPPALPTDHPPLALALVLDRSGSMAGAKLEVTKACARMLVERLRPVDQMALVTFDGQVDLGAPMAAVDRKALTRTIDGIHVGGSTNLSGGWLKGLEECRRAHGDPRRRILLLSDGQANEGIQDPAALENLTASAFTQGVSSSTIGFGADFNEDLLTAMADAGQGNAYFAADVEEVPPIFQQEFEGLASVVAQNLSVELRPSEDVLLQRVLNEYRKVDVDGGMQLQLGDAYGGEERRVVFKLLVPAVKTLGERKIAEVVVRYVAVGDEIAAHEIRIPVLANQRIGVCNHLTSVPRTA